MEAGACFVDSALLYVADKNGLISKAMLLGVSPAIPVRISSTTPMEVWSLSKFNIGLLCSVSDNLTGVKYLFILLQVSWRDLS